MGEALSHPGIRNNFFFGLNVRPIRPVALMIIAMGPVKDVEYATAHDVAEGDIMGSCYRYGTYAVNKLRQRRLCLS